MSSSSSQSSRARWVLVGGVSLAVAAGLGVFLWKRERDEKIRRRERLLLKKEDGVNIGAIFGMDVGGTLAKIVYFEANNMTGNGDGDSSDVHEQEEKEYGEGSTISGTGLKRSATETGSLRKKNMDGLSRNGNGSESKLGRMGSHGNLAQLGAPEHQAALQELYSYMDSSNLEGSPVSADVGLTFDSEMLGGRLHFLHFETRNMISAINILSQSDSFTQNIRTIGCTGGGAVKYAKVVEEDLGIKFNQLDELGSLVRGMHFALTSIDGECYTYRKDDPPPPNKINTFTSKLPKFAADTVRKARSMSVDFSSKLPCSPTSPTIKGKTSVKGKDGEGSKEDEDRDSNREQEQEQEPLDEQRWHRDVKEYTKRVELPYQKFMTNEQFPYLVVNIGTGVSILKITAPGKYERVSGSSVGGGTYWGLCRLLVGSTSYEDVLDLAETGDASEVDMLVRDIYGGDYDDGNLSGSMVASSFGKLTMKDKVREGIREQDLAIALLMMITNNIGQVSYLNAQLHNCSKIFFIGSFLRHNKISCRRLSFAIDFWSKGKMEALFLNHEGYVNM